MGNEFDRVIVVEDNTNWQDLLLHLLKTRVSKVEITNNYSQALNLILRLGDSDINVLPVCVIDMNLGSYVDDKYDGLGLLAICKIRKIPTVVVSGYITLGLGRRLYKEFGVVNSFDKANFSEDEFMESIEEALKSPYRSPDFRVNLNNLTETMEEYYKEAHSIIVNRHNQRTMVRGGLSISDEQIQKEEIKLLDQRYRTLSEKIMQVDSIDEVNNLRIEMIEESNSWMNI